MARYGEKAQQSVERTMRKRKRGTLESGSGKKVKSRKQAIAIGLSEAREKGAKVPPKKKGSSSRSKKSSSSRSKSGSSKKSASRSSRSKSRSSGSSRSRSKKS